MSKESWGASVVLKRRGVPGGLGLSSSAAVALPSLLLELNVNSHIYKFSIRTRAHAQLLDTLSGSLSKAGQAAITELRPCFEEILESLDKDEVKALSKSMLDVIGHNKEQLWNPEASPRRDDLSMSYKDWKEVQNRARKGRGVQWKKLNKWLHKANIIYYPKADANRTYSNSNSKANEELNADIPVVQGDLVNQGGESDEEEANQDIALLMAKVYALEDTVVRLYALGVRMATASSKAYIGQVDVQYKMGEELAKTKRKKAPDALAPYKDKSEQFSQAIDRYQSEFIAELDKAVGEIRDGAYDVDETKQVVSEDADQADEILHTHVPGLASPNGVFNDEEATYGIEPETESERAKTDPPSQPPASTSSSSSDQSSTETSSSDDDIPIVQNTKKQSHLPDHGVASLKPAKRTREDTTEAIKKKRKTGGRNYTRRRLRY
ncbi:hypothetical protein BDV95DRAFT_596789 [Massariosphaeria phaeospora]|uniref:Uncharacterized protein n=1 Tax=Massariosphaeria phaeospora TaxID=100035 RepID=A0A7C8IBN6_9PLEO|nr:hypothetical protein BDV95DRAFT_596789 [Massariosphaeria phaeospora]